MSYMTKGRRTLLPSQLLDMLAKASMSRSQIETASKVSRSTVHKALNALWDQNEIVVDHEEVHSSGAKVPFYRAATKREKAALNAAPQGQAETGRARATIKAAPPGQKAVDCPPTIGSMRDPLVAMLFG